MEIITDIEDIVLVKLKNLGKTFTISMEQKISM